jgi:hypothetical protein
MRAPGLQRLVAYCLNPSCENEGLIDVSKYPDDTDVPALPARSCAPIAARVAATSR